MAAAVTVNFFLPPYAADWVYRNKFKVAGILFERSKQWRPGSTSWADYLKEQGLLEARHG